jgi:hypothetical protein
MIRGSSGGTNEAYASLSAWAPATTSASLRAEVLSLEPSTDGAAGCTRVADSGADTRGLGTGER